MIVENGGSDRASARLSTRDNGADEGAFDALFEYAPYACVVTDGDGIVVRVNERAADLLAAPGADLIGKPLAAAFDLEDGTLLQSCIREAAAATDPVREMMRASDANREPRDLLTTVVRRPIGELTVALLWFFEDLTTSLERERALHALNLELERRVADRAAALAQTAEERDVTFDREQKARAEAIDLLAQLVHERARLEAILQQIPAGVVIADAPTGEIVQANAQAESIFGEPIRASSVSEYSRYTGFDGEGRRLGPEEWPLARALRRGERIIDEDIDIIRHDGELRTITMSALPLQGPDGSVVTAVATFSDSTNRKRMLDRSRFLAEASAALSASLDAGEILATVAELAVPRLADECVVFVRHEDGAVYRYVATSADSEPPQGQEGPLTAANVPHPLRTGESELISDVADDREAQTWRANEIARLRELGVRSSMCVPLVGRSGTFAAISFSTIESGRRLDRDDLQLAQEFARHAALAIENARLYTRLGAERDRLRTLLDRLHQGVIVLDRECRIEFANGEAGTALGEAVEAGAVLPEEWLDLDLRAFARELFATSRVREERVSDEQKTYVLLGIPAAGRQDAVLVFMDISERERMERAEREFVTNAAHELRTPLAAITTAVEVLQAGAKEEPTERDHFLGHIEREAARLARLTRALLVLARAQTGQEPADRGSVDVKALLEDVRDALGSEHAEGVSVRCEQGLIIAAERELIEQVIRNLAVNALRYAESRVVLEGRAADGSVEIEVRDDGPGIPFADRRRVFERFYRGHTRDSDGFGLGLAIVHQAIRALGGTVDLARAPEGGTAARVRLPKAGAEVR